MNSEKSEINYGDILSQLDQAVIDYHFPTYNNVNFPVANMRLVSFRSISEWIILFERIAYNVSEGTFLSMISAFGNKIQNPGLQSVIEVIEPAPGTTIWDDEMNYILNESKFEMLIYGKKVSFSFSKKDYERAKIIDYSNMDEGLKLLRVIAYKMGDELFMYPIDLLRRIGREEIPLFLTINEWNHPDVYNNTSELPSLNICFQSLAKAIEENKKKNYDCKRHKNSHWYEWNESV